MEDALISLSLPLKVNKWMLKTLMMMISDRSLVTLVPIIHSIDQVHQMYNKDARMEQKNKWGRSLFEWKLSHLKICVRELQNIVNNFTEIRWKVISIPSIILRGKTCLPNSYFNPCCYVTGKHQLKHSINMDDVANLKKETNMIELNSDFLLQLLHFTKGLYSTRIYRWTEFL